MAEAEWAELDLIGIPVAGAPDVATSAVFLAPSDVDPSVELRVSSVAAGTGAAVRPLRRSATKLGKRALSREWAAVSNT